MAPTTLFMAEEESLPIYEYDLSLLSQLRHDPDGFFRGTDLVMRIPRPSKIRFYLPPDHHLVSSTLSYWTNYPIIPSKGDLTLAATSVKPSDKSDRPFDRKKFYCLQDTTFDGSSNWQVTFVVFRAGAFDFHLSSETPEGSFKTPTYNFIVDPVLSVNGNLLSIDSICLQTAITKWLGKLNNWKDYFRISSKTGYTMIHLTPVQQLGESGSAYSLYHQLRINDNLFDESILASSTEKDREAKKIDVLNKTLREIERENGILFMTDVVWNHTANNSPWLREHPEAGYNTENSPHLIPAYELDEALYQFSASGCPSELRAIHDEESLQHVIRYIKQHIIQNLKLWEYYVINEAQEVEKFKTEIRSYGSSFFHPHLHYKIDSSDVFQAAERMKRYHIVFNNSDGSRFPNKIDTKNALRVVADFTKRNMDDMISFFQQVVRLINLESYKMYDSDIEAIILNLTNQARYERLADHGPKLPAISASSPITKRYFTCIYEDDKKTKLKAALANNGWIWDGNPRVDFAGKESRAYLRREVIVWEDCVKLRYGHSEDDNPWLWKHMAEYTTMMAKLFHAFRIDNAHSTPINAAQYFLDVARQTRPELFTIAELFTGSSEIDANFVSRLGLNALIREAMGPGDSRELGRLVHRNSNIPIGSLRSNPYSLCSNTTPLKPILPRALFVDCTHDNETPAQKRTVEDTLSTSALVAFTHCSIGSTRGYDELIPKTLDLIRDKRRYQLLAPNAEDTKNNGILHVKSILNKLHKQLDDEGYTETHVHQIDDQLIVVSRSNPVTHSSYHLIARTAFPFQANYSNEVTARIPGEFGGSVFAAKLYDIKTSEFKEDETYINGFGSSLYVSQTELSSMCRIDRVQNNEEVFQDVHLYVNGNFTPGSIISFQTTLTPQSTEKLQTLQELLSNNVYITEIISKFNLLSLNVVLYRCEPEEQSVTGSGCYSIPNYGPLIYCGLAGLYPLLDDLRHKDDLGHPLFNNLREGDWLMNYIADRLGQSPELLPLQTWFRNCFDCVKSLPRHLIPTYFDKVVTRVYNIANEKAISLMSSFIQSYSNDNKNVFILKLAMSSLQLFCSLASAPLISSNRLPELGTVPLPSLAAGLPHFASGYMRSWGRDTFISIRGLMLVTGRYQDAKTLIRGFASCLRHGLIPNLLDSGNRPRYNARDATWFFLQAIQDYCTMAPDGTKLLNEKITRIFPTDDFNEYQNKYAGGYPSMQSTLAEIVQEILQKHASGIRFREWNAGHEIDDRMTDNGFNINIYLDERTGFVHGGNTNNCGTWMDKMGESQRAGNSGVPSTPRDGAPVEIVGLLKSTLRWLSTIAGSKDFPFKGVKLQNGNTLSYQEWNDKIQSSFEKHFFVPPLGNEHNYVVDSSLIHKRGIYKDVYGSAHPWTDYQLRPNYCIAMAVAPELFDREHALKALSAAEEFLMGKLGMKTLDPDDMNYRPNYDVNEDSTDVKTSKGANYHQGPEWVWPRGFFLRAYVAFHKSDKSKDELMHYTFANLVEHRHQITSSPWHGIVELTNQHGAVCRSSCDSQAWSTATLLDAIYDLHHLRHLSFSASN